MPERMSCGDIFYRNGRLFGVAHRWTGDGVSVDLAENQRVETSLGLPTDAVMTREQFASGEFTFRKLEWLAVPVLVEAIAR